MSREGWEALAREQDAHADYLESHGEHGYVRRAVDQPATKYLDRNIEPPRKCTNDPRRQLRCYTCGRVRWAKNMIVHVYYDCTRFFCAEGHVMYRNAWRTKRPNSKGER